MLTAKQEKFAQAIISGMNQSDAYRHAYETESMSAPTLWNEAYLLAGHPEVSLRLAELREGIQSQFVGDQTDILRELQRIGFADLSNLVSWSSSGIQLKDSATLPPELTSLVSEVGETRNKDGAVTGTRIKLHSKLDALDKMAKILGAYNEPTSHTDIKITKITVVLPPDKIVDVSEYKVVSDPEEVDDDETLPSPTAGDND